MKTIEQNTDEFIKYVGIVKRWFKDEELEVSDYVIGRMASRIQTLFKDETKAQLMELLGEKEPETITIDDPAHPTIFDKAAFTRNQFRDQLLAKISGDRKG
jgi:hypothetical protein